MADEEFEADLDSLVTADRRTCPTRSGVDKHIEGLADYMLAKERRGVTKHSEMKDYFSIGQMDLRRSREVYPTQGFPEANLFSGLYRRAYNPKTRGSTSSKATPNLEALDHE